MTCLISLSNIGNEYCMSFIKKAEKEGESIFYNPDCKHKEQNTLSDNESEVILEHSEPEEQMSMKSMFFNIHSKQEEQKNTSCDNVSEDMFEDTDPVHEVNSSTFDMLDSSESEKEVTTFTDKYFTTPPRKIYDKSRAMKNTYKRKIKKCPLCPKLIRNVNGHLQAIHNLSPSESKDLSYSTRCRRTLDTKGRKCPLRGCENNFPYSRLDIHLKRRHRLTSDDPTYLSICCARKRNNALTSIKHKIKYSDLSEKLSSQFIDYLTTLSGGKKNMVIAQQQGYKIRQILHGANVNNILEITEKNCFKRLESFIEEFSKTHESNSTVTYLSILISFLKFIRVEIAGVDIPEITNIIENVRKWKKHYRSQKCVRKNVHDVPVNEVRLFEGSEVVQNSLELLASFKLCENIDINPETHAALRNVLIMLISFRNCQRSCALYNMTIEEYSEAEYIQEENGYIVHVKEHKTKGEHGPAQIALTSQLYSLLEIYITKVRCKLVTRYENCKALFVTWSGKRMTADDLNKGLQMVWSKAGLKTKIGTTVLRHLITTRIHKDDPENKGPVAEHLKHRLLTAEAFYKDQCKGRESYQTSKSIYKHASGNENALINFNNMHVLQARADSNDCLSQSFSITNQVHEEENVHLNGYDCVPKSKFRLQNGRGRKAFSDEERKVIENIFKKAYIDNHCMPSISTIREFMKKDEQLALIVQNNEYKDTQVKGCLYNLVQKAKRSSSK